MDKNQVTFGTGDLLEVVRKDGLRFKCLVVENYEGGFVSKVLDKDEGVGTSNWQRFDNVDNDNRFQVIDECSDITVLAKSQKSSARGTLTLNENLSQSEMDYYETDLDEDRVAIFCSCDGYGGWSFRNKSEKLEALKESYFNSQIAKYNNHTVVAN